MEHFAYSFLVSMLHSLWQAALVLLVGYLWLVLAMKQTPLQKRNLFLGLLATQVVLSIATFYIVHIGGLQPGILTYFSSFNEINKNTSLQSWSAFIFWIYILIILFRSLYLFISWKKFLSANKMAMQKPSIHFRLFTTAKALEFGIHKKVLVWLSENITTPVTYGFMKPIILLPIALVNQLSIEETETLIIHELTHIKNNDFLWNWFVIVMEIAYFFNPFIYFLSSQIKKEREKSCDVQVIHYKYAPLVYAEALLKTARIRQATLSLQLGAVNNNQDLLKRIHFFSNSANFNFRRQINLLPLLIMPALLFLNVFLVLQFAPLKNELQLKPAAPEVANYSLKEIPELLVTSAVDGRDINNTTKEITGDIPVAATPIKLALEKTLSASQIDINPDGNDIDELPMAISVAHEVTENKETKEVLIQETNSEGNKITIALHAELSNGIWIMQPLWIISEIKKSIDSSMLAGKDSLIYSTPAIQ